METIGARRALELLTDVVDVFGPDTVYEKMVAPGAPDNGLGCRYEWQGSPSCLVGQALFRAGVPTEKLVEFDLRDLPARSISSRGVGVTPEAAQVFQAAQTVQDADGTWGEALAAARATYEDLIKE
jgi:hypothetical protein